MDRHERQLSSPLLASNTAKTTPDPSFTNSKEELTNFEPLTFAQELTRCELELLCFLGPEELINAVFVRDASTKTMETTDEATFEKEVPTTYELSTDKYFDEAKFQRHFKQVIMT